MQMGPPTHRTTTGILTRKPDFYNATSFAGSPLHVSSIQDTGMSDILLIQG